MFMKKTAEERKFCPLVRKSCIGEACMWSTSLRGRNGNTGEDVDEEGCAIAWLPMLLIENSKQTRSTAAGIESFRNEMVKGNAQLLEVQTLRAVQDAHKERTRSDRGMGGV